MIDALDRQILTILQADGRTATAEIARRLDMAPSAIFERIKKLEASRVILGYHARLAPKALGLGLVAYVFVRSDDMADEAAVADRLAEIPEVLEVHHIAGEDCFLVKVRAPDTDALGRLLRERIGAIASVRSTRTTIVLSSVKESTAIPVPAERPGEFDGAFRIEASRDRR